MASLAAKFRPFPHAIARSPLTRLPLRGARMAVEISVLAPTSMYITEAAGCFPRLVNAGPFQSMQREGSDFPIRVRNHATQLIWGNKTTENPSAGDEQNRWRETTAHANKNETAVSAKTPAPTQNVRNYSS